MVAKFMSSFKFFDGAELKLKSTNATGQPSKRSLIGNVITCCNESLPRETLGSSVETTRVIGAGSGSGGAPLELLTADACGAGGTSFSLRSAVKLFGNSEDGVALLSMLTPSSVNGESGQSDKPMI